MVKRIIFGILCVVFAVVMLIFRNTPAFMVAAMVISFIAIYEMNTAMKIKNKPIMWISMVAGTLVPVFYEYGDTFCAWGNKIGFDFNPKFFVCLYILVLFICMLFEYENTKFQDVAAVIIGSLGVPFAITRLMFLRDIAEWFPDRNYTSMHGLFLIIFAMFSAWITDTCAYFTGSFLGKHKMCPKISPKKSIEGAVGGVVGCVIVNVILYAVFENLVFKSGVNNYLAVILLTIFLSVISMCGDLTASVIKRNFGVKDFGNLIPGHGGVMDRFDSEIFVLVAFYAVFNIFEVQI